MFRALLVCAVLVLALASCATGSGSGFSREANKERAAHDRAADKDQDKPSDQKKDESKPAEPPKLTIVADPSNARISVDGRYLGTGVVSIDSFGLGQRIVITAEAPSYRTKTMSVALWGQTDTVTLELEPIVGILQLQGADLSGASFSLPGWTIVPGPNRLIIGEHTLRVRKFGYADQVQQVTIRENETTVLDLEFEPVPFSLTGLSTNQPDGFNPDSAALAASATVRFTASGPGHARAVLRDRNEAEIAHWDFARLATWDQSLVWDGTLAGAALPDGVYRLELTGGADDVDTIHLNLTLTLSRSLIDRDRSSLGPAAGLLWTPVPEVLSPGTLQVSTLALAHAEGGLVQAPVSTSLRLSPVRGWEFFAQTSFRLWSEYELNSLYATVAIKQRIALDSPNFRLAWVLGGTLGSWLYDGAGVPPTDFLTTFPGLRALLPASWTWGKWTLVVVPELDWSPWSPSTAYETASVADEGSRFWAYGRVGVAYDPGPFSVAFSGVARTRGFDLGGGWMAPAHGGLEARFPLPGTPVTLTGYLSVSAYSSVDYAWYGGAGVSFLIPASLTLDLVSQLATSP